MTECEDTKPVNMVGSKLAPTYGNTEKEARLNMKEQLDSICHDRLNCWMKSCGRHRTKSPRFCVGIATHSKLVCKRVPMTMPRGGSYFMCFPPGAFTCKCICA